MLVQLNKEKIEDSAYAKKIVSTTMVNITLQLLNKKKRDVGRKVFLEAIKFLMYKMMIDVALTQIKHQR